MGSVRATRHGRGRGPRAVEPGQLARVFALHFHLAEGGQRDEMDNLGPPYLGRGALAYFARLDGIYSKQIMNSKKSKERLTKTF